MKLFYEILQKYTELQVQVDGKTLKLSSKQKNEFTSNCADFMKVLKKMLPMLEISSNASQDKSAIIVVREDSISQLNLIYLEMMIHCSDYNDTVLP